MIGRAADSATDPILSIPMEVRDLDPDWANCIGGINGVYDPPIALTPADSVAKPTVPGANPRPTSDAAPASSPKPTDPPVTAKPNQPSPTARPEEDPKPSQGDPSHDGPSPSEDTDPKESNTEKENSVQGNPTRSPEESRVEQSPQKSTADDSQSPGNPDRPSTAQPTREPDQPADSDLPDPSASHTNEESSHEQPSEQQSGSGNAPSPVGTGQATDGQESQGAENDSAPSVSGESNDETPVDQTGKAPESTANALSVLLSAAQSAANEATTQGAQADPGNPGDEDPRESNGEGVVSATNDQPGSSAPQPSNNAASAHEIQASPGQTDRTNPNEPTQQGSMPPLNAPSAESTAQPPVESEGTQRSQIDGAHVTEDATQAAATPSIIQIANGGSAAVNRDGDSIVVSQDGLSAVAAPGGVATIGTRVYSAASDGGAVVIDGSATHPVEQAASPSAQATAFTANGQAMSASREGSAVVIADGSQTVTAQPGSNIKVGTQDIELQSDGAQLAVGTASFAVPDEANTETTELAAIWTKDGSVFTAISQDGSIALKGPDMTTSLPAGAKATIGGEVIMLPASGDVLLHGEQTASFEPTPTSTGASSGAKTSAQSDGGFVASAAGGDVVIQQSHTTFTLDAGRQTVVGGQTLSAMSTGHGVIVDGDETVSLPSSSSTAESSDPPTSRSASGTDAAQTSEVEATTAATTDQGDSSPESAGGKVRSVTSRLSLFVVCVIFSTIW